MEHFLFFCCCVAYYYKLHVKQTDNFKDLNKNCTWFYRSVAVYFCVLQLSAKHLPLTLLSALGNDEVFHSSLILY